MLYTIMRVECKPVRRSHKNGWNVVIGIRLDKAAHLWIVSIKKTAEKRGNRAYLKKNRRRRDKTSFLKLENEINQISFLFKYSKAHSDLPPIIFPWDIKPL